MNITEKFAHIESLKSRIEALHPRKEWDDVFFRRVKIDFTYNTNKLEGSTLIYGQTIRLLRDFFTPKDAIAGEVLDMLNHQLVFNHCNVLSPNLSQRNSSFQ